MFDTTTPRPAPRVVLVAVLSAALLAPVGVAALPALGPAGGPLAGPGAAPAPGPSPTGPATTPPAPALAADRAVPHAERAARSPRSVPDAREQRRAAFAHFTLRSRDTRDLRGIERSLYRGRFFAPALEAKRRCIVKRESEGQYDLVSSGGSYFGAYQVSRALARGATWMMLLEHRRLLGAPAAKRILADLRKRPMSTWPRYWQDAAFSTVMNWEHTGSGASHWAGGRWHC